MYKTELIRTIYFNELKSWLGTPLIKVITGMRRVGKSTLIRQWAEYILSEKVCPESNLLYIECDSLEFSDLIHWKQLKELTLPIDKMVGKKVLLVDEIQNIEDWEIIIAALQKQGDWDIYITGSNSQILSGELATRLSGRYVQMEVLPFNYREHLQILGLNKHSSEEFQKYLEFGGMPTLYHIDDDRRLRQQTLEAIYSTIVLKDIVERYKIRNIALLERIVWYFFDNIGNLSNAKKIADFCKSQKLSVGVETVQNYMSYLEHCFIMHRARRHDLKGKKILEVNEKLFANDLGMRNAVLRRKTQDIGVLLENIVYLELLRRGFSITIGNFNSWEIDFVAERGDIREYYQVCYLISSEETEIREFRSLEILKDNYPKTVLSMDEVDFSRNGINHKYIPDWLLDS